MIYQFGMITIEGEEGMASEASAGIGEMFHDEIVAIQKETLRTGWSDSIADQYGWLTAFWFDRVGNKRFFQ